MRPLPSRTAMRLTSLLPVAVAAALWSPVPGWAALYKCTVDGKTVYQQRACGNDQGTQSVLSTGSSRPPPAPPSPSAQGTPPGAAPPGPAPSRAPLDEAGREGAARRAFAHLASGDVDAYHQMLCPEAQAKYEAAGGKRILRDFSRRIRADKAELTTVIGHRGASLYIDATRVGDAVTGRREPVGLVYTTTVHQDKHGAPCISGLAVTSRSSAPR